MNPDPAVMMTQTMANAVQLHELYTTYVTAGFREQQAMQICLTILQAGIAISAAQQAQGGIQ